MANTMKLHDYEFASVTMTNQKTVLPMWVRTDTKEEDHLIVCLGSAPILGEASETTITRAMVGSITYTGFTKKG